MTVHYKIDKSHPDYAEYREKYEKLLKEFMDKWNAILEKYKGQEGKVTERPVSLEYKQFLKKLAKLDKEYDYLYSIPLTEEEERIREEYLNGGKHDGLQGNS